MLSDVPVAPVEIAHRRVRRVYTEDQLYYGIARPFVAALSPSSQSGFCLPTRLAPGQWRRPS